MTRNKEKLLDDNRCFACGAENPIGLKMEVAFHGERARAEVTLGDEYQGWKGVAHGGIVATIMDEVMAHAVIKSLGEGLTGSIEIRFRAPVPLGEPLAAEGWVSETRGKLAVTSAAVTLRETGKVLAEAKGRFVLQEKGG